MSDVLAFSSGYGRFVKKTGDTMSGTLNSFSIIPATTATYTLGDSTHYYTQLYATRHYLNSTAYLDGATADVVTTSGRLFVGGSNGTLRFGASNDGAEYNISSSNTGTLAIFGASTNTLNLALLDGMLGVATSAPTHSITLASTATGIALYNTADQTTNYERVRQYWSGNVFSINGEIGGTGTARSILISAFGTTTQALALNNTSSSGFIESRGASATASAIIHRISGTLSSSSGVQYGLSVSPTFNQSGTAGYTALLINPTETTTGSGTKLLIDAQVGGVSKFKVDNTGVVTSTGDITVPDEAYGAGWNGSLEVPTKNAVYDQVETKLNTSAFSGLSKITVGTSAPGSPSVGDVWVDTN